MLPIANMHHLMLDHMHMDNDDLEYDIYLI